MQNVIDRALGIHENALRMRDYRSNILASNIANADTPGFKAKDVDFKRVLIREVQPTGVDPVRVRSTHSRHIANNAPLDAATQYRTPLQASLDGNTVDAHAEHTRFAENTVHYQASLQFLGGKFKRLISAIKGE
ncbi:MAG: flagellar basal body rod protein FlgB [Pseudomonadota bacterium]